MGRHSRTLQLSFCCRLSWSFLSKLRTPIFTKLQVTIIYLLLQVLITFGNQCGPGWWSNTFRSDGAEWCYKQIEQNLTFSDALQHCNGEGAELLTLQGNGEETFVVNQMTCQAAWLGIKFNNLNQQNEWRWLDETSVQNSGWYDPNTKFLVIAAKCDDVWDNNFAYLDIWQGLYSISADDKLIFDAYWVHNTTTSIRGGPDGYLDSPTDFYNLRDFGVTTPLDPSSVLIDDQGRWIHPKSNLQVDDKWVHKEYLIGKVADLGGGDLKSLTIGIEADFAGSYKLYLRRIKIVNNDETQLGIFHDTLQYTGTSASTGGIKGYEYIQGSVRQPNCAILTQTDVWEQAMCFETHCAICKMIAPSPSTTPSTTATPSSTGTQTPTPSATPTPSSTATQTSTSTSSYTVTQTSTPSTTPTASSTATQTSAPTSSLSPTVSMTLTPSATAILPTTSTVTLAHTSQSTINSVATSSYAIATSNITNSPSPIASTPNARSAKCCKNGRRTLRNRDMLKYQEHSNAIVLGLCS